VPRILNFSESPVDLPPLPPSWAARARPAKHAQQLVPCLVCGLTIVKDDAVIPWTTQSGDAARQLKHLTTPLHIDCAYRLTLAKRAAKLRAKGAANR